MIAIFLFIAVLLIVLSFLIEKHPYILAGYKSNTPKELIKFIRKSFFITGITYLPLSIIPIFINDSFTLTIISITPMLIMLILISRKSFR